MSEQQVIGTVDNGSRIDVDFGFYAGPAGVVKAAEGILRISMIAAVPRGTKEPKQGTVDGKAVEVLSVARSSFNSRFVNIVARTAADDGGNGAG